MVRRQVERPSQPDAPFSAHSPGARQALQDAHRNTAESVKQPPVTEAVHPEARKALQRSTDFKAASNKI